ncbi:MAG: rRNA maturation RNase YbeY [Bacteroidia bacterium]|nr:rRNA maturation RNase YbeY [Bacteroidia bacterium]NND10808.1 rRNA maturation RNase YbeY [Flavobacteriaceae bacterium]MBT8309396.1 rRNA maturation RNase YbeY [Bacteroidia bacterium]NNK28585.1 rRNA maturation RNase YbeY [Flavobacteriaceae bacterium]NNL60961.1 rRNA maturation RNase YbeY [Flavobacteriaceae bacterium]
MIEYNFETDFDLDDKQGISAWISNVIATEGFILGEINYIFCDDDYLHKLNVEFLDHNTLTDIISFDYSVGKELRGDVFISIDRVRDNAKAFKVNFTEELHRVIVHGILHFCGFKDKTDKDAELMRQKENRYLGQRIDNP